jgi:hypothetical protein
MSNQKPLDKHPFSMEKYDDGSLNDMQQTKINKKKVIKQ